MVAFINSDTVQGTLYKYRCKQVVRSHQHIYGLSMFLASLKPVVGLSPHHVMNSQHCAVHQVTAHGGCGGADVFVHVCPNWPCFTGVPKATGEWSLPTTQDWTQRGWYLLFLHLCLKATYLMFEGRIYQQIHSIAIGLPVSVVVANLVMEDIECKALLSFHTPPHFWRRYVNDTRTVLPWDLVKPFHVHFNSTDSKIQFTVERESEEQLPFLDVLLTREDDGSISCQCSIKPLSH